MRRIWAFLVFAVIGAGVAWIERLPFAEPLRAAASEWLGANSLSDRPLTVTGVEIDSPTGLSPLDTALIVRAVERFHPLGIAFLEPISDGGDVSLLASRLGTANLPIVFTGSGGFRELPGVSVRAGAAPISNASCVEPHKRPIAAGPAEPHPGVFIAGNWKDRAVPSATLALLLTLDRAAFSSVTGSIPGTIRAGAILAPVDESGFGRINKLAAAYAETISFADLMVQVERSERGEVSPELDGLFRGRIVVVSKSGTHGAEGLAALRNNLVEALAPSWVVAIAVALLASLPFWARSPLERFIWATLATLTWMLLALAIYQQYRVTPPLLPIALAPFLALVPLRIPDKTGPQELSAGSTITPGAS